MTVIKSLCKSLYGETAETTLYHYTSLSGLEAIIQTRSLRASEIRYMNDAAELLHTSDVIHGEIARRLERSEASSGLLEQLGDWMSDRLTNGHMLFVVSFTTNGNLLSQWRGYGKVGKGVSLGFDPAMIYDCARRQSFRVGKCIYDPDRHADIAARIVSAIEALAGEQGADTSTRHPSQSWYPVFESVEADLLSIATLLKHPSFKEEDEWRVVSSVFSDCVDAAISYREGISMLVPYIDFNLDCSSKLDFEHICLGPTPNSHLSMSSLAKFLSRKGITPSRGIMYCDIPYRQW